MLLHNIHLFILLCRMLSVYKLTDEEIKNSTIDILPSEKSLLGVIAPHSETGVTTQIPAMEVMKVYNLSVCLLIPIRTAVEVLVSSFHISRIHICLFGFGHMSSILVSIQQEVILVLLKIV